MIIDNLSSRKKVAREAASLLYSGVEKEYKQAKLKAAKALKSHFLPSNFEVALELDKLAEENECSTRQERLIQMRKEALELMKILKTYNPVLIGSVWRGTANRKSDIDITVYNGEPNNILGALERSNLKIQQGEWMTVTKQGQKKTSFHTYLELPNREKVEIIVRGPEEFGRKEKCEIYGDAIIGLRIKELERLLNENPLKRFVPF